MSGHDKGARAAGPAPGGISPAVRERIAQSFTRVEDVVYVGLGVLLAAGALILLVNAGVTLRASGPVGTRCPGRSSSCSTASCWS